MYLLIELSNTNGFKFKNEADRIQCEFEFIDHTNIFLGNAYDGPQVEIWALGE